MLQLEMQGLQLSDSIDIMILIETTLEDLEREEFYIKLQKVLKGVQKLDFIRNGF